jgi:hypothetical protein
LTGNLHSASIVPTCSAIVIPLFELMRMHSQY